MNQSPLHHLSEKLLSLLKKAKDLLSKDYSMQDLKNLKSLPKELQQRLRKAQSSFSKKSIHTSATKSDSARFDIKQLPSLARQFVVEKRNAFGILLGVLLALFVNAYLISPYSQKIQDQLDMRPAQWSQLQSLIKLNKTSGASSATGASAASSAPSYGGMATVTLLDDMELQKIRSTLTARGLKPSVLRLTADNPPKIEFQSSDAMFSVLLDVLDELRITWRLYPEQLNVVSTGGAGVVNISGVLMQYGGQSGMSR